ncbi:polysaccharide deacetylase family protein [Devosia albogilva]|uniref:Chitooligosaccharide deacetylase n=1 Tax=Devosia albogilva TaxID=429726 RepID=A0ABW5QNL3_9HYPH
MPLAVTALMLAGCAKPPSSQPQLVSAYQAERSLSTASVVPAAIVTHPAFDPGTLAGRTLAVASADDIVLEPGEVVLTFDDGPRPGKTEAILATLDRFGVKATFLMLGEAAARHPVLARKVAARGHTVGSHTYSHADLSTLTRQAAIDEIARGEDAVATALSSGGETASPFFRFPYLSQTGFLRTSLTHSGAVVLDVGIDSKDYYSDTADVVAARTLQRLEARGSGIILFHDIHQRTVDMLPGFLAELNARGYSVVRLVPRDNSIFGRDLITAELM